jgi:hypothetical protein
MLALRVRAARVLWAVYQLSLGAGTPIYYDRLAAIPRLEVMALCGGVAEFLLTLGAWKIEPKARGAAMAGAALPLFLLGLAGQVLAPTAAYVVVVPVLLAALAVAAGDGVGGRLVALILGAPVIGYMISLGHFVMQGVGPNMPMAAALPLALVVMALLPLWDALSARAARIGAAVLLVVALGTALTVRLDPMADTVAVYSADK